MSRLAQLLAFEKDSPNDSFILFALAKEYEKAKNVSKAFEYYNKLVEVDVNYVGTYYHLAKLHEEEEGFDKALEVYEQGIKIATSVGDLHALSELKGAKLNLELEM